MICTTCNRPAEDGYVNEAAGERCVDPCHDERVQEMLCPKCQSNNVIGPFEMDGVADGKYQAEGLWWIVCRECGSTARVDIQADLPPVKLLKHLSDEQIKQLVDRIIPQSAPFKGEPFPSSPEFKDYPRRVAEEANRRAAKRYAA